MLRCDPSKVAKLTFPLPSRRGLVSRHSQHCWRQAYSQAFPGRSIYPPTGTHQRLLKKERLITTTPLLMMQKSPLLIRAGDRYAGTGCVRRKKCLEEWVPSRTHVTGSTPYRDVVTMDERPPLDLLLLKNAVVELLGGKNNTENILRQLYVNGISSLGIVVLCHSPLPIF